MNAHAGRTETMLQVKAISKSFGGLQALGDVSFEVGERQIVSIIGPNGAGKTTLFNVLTGVYRPDGGQVLFAGQRISGLPPERIARRGIARTFQNIRLFGAMTAAENLLVGRHTHIKYLYIEALIRSPRFYRQERAARVRAMELLDYMGLKHRAFEPARNLAYGEQRRLEIARALALEPKLLLLDEPAAGMNPHETHELRDVIRRLRDDLGITILLIEHHMQLVMAISDRIAVLDYGSRIAEGTPDEIRKSPQVIEAYLGKGALETFHD
jgi:branched-chain amino acid transport system ATP-binding protein